MGWERRILAAICLILQQNPDRSGDYGLSGFTASGQAGSVIELSERKRFCAISVPVASKVVWARQFRPEHFCILSVFL